MTRSAPWLLPGLLAVLTAQAAAPARAQDSRVGTLVAHGSAYAPLVQLPGRTGRPSQRIYRNGIAQSIDYGGSSNAVITVALPPQSVGTGPTISLTKPTKAGITVELRRAFPDEVMTVVARPMHNAYGPFGLAIGARCLYAWQWIDNIAGERETADRLFAGSGNVPASLRVKLCGTGSPDRLVAQVEGLVLRDPFRITRATTPSRPPPRRRAAAAPPKPASPAPETPVVPAAPPPPAPAPAPAPAPGFGVVPVPGTERGTGRRFLVPEGSSAAPQSSAPAQDLRPPRATAPPVPLPSQPDGGRRFLTGAAPHSSPGAAVPFVPRPAQDQPPGTPTRLNDLPARAYSGPQSR